METINENTRICPLCGKKIHYRNVYEDGSDWLGHQRGSSKSYTIGYECTCDNINFKKMCLNCSFYQTDTCVNKNVIEKYKNTIETLDSPFSVEKISITVKKPTNACDCWKVNSEIISRIFKQTI
jgi:hypothetical protein